MNSHLAASKIDEQAAAGHGADTQAADQQTADQQAADLQAADLQAADQQAAGKLESDRIRCGADSSAKGAGRSTEDDGSTDPADRRMSLRCWLAVNVLLLGPAACAVLVGDLVIAAVFIAIAVAAFSGYRTGLVMIVAGLLGFALAYHFAPDLGRAQETHVSHWLGTTGITNRVVSIGVIGFGIAISTATALTLIGNHWVKRKQIDSANRWFGFCFGAVEGIAAVACFLGGMLILEPIERERAQMRDPNDRRGQFISKLVLTTADQVHRSRIGPLIENYHPFKVFPQLNKIQQVQDSVQTLSHPQRIEQLLHHPSIRQLQQRPEIQQAVSRIRSDPQIRQILNSGKPMNPTTVMALLNHPAILELVDQPGFLDQAVKAMHAMTPTHRQ